MIRARASHVSLGSAINQFERPTGRNASRSRSRQFLYAVSSPVPSENRAFPLRQLAKSRSFHCRMIDPYVEKDTPLIVNVPWLKVLARRTGSIRQRETRLRRVRRCLCGTVDETDERAHGRERVLPVKSAQRKAMLRESTTRYRASVE